MGDRSRQPAAHLVGGPPRVRGGGQVMFMFFKVVRSSSETTAREYQRLSAGTRYQGAAAVLVFSNTSCQAAIYSSHRSRASRSEMSNFQNLVGSSSLPRKCFFLFFLAYHEEDLEDGASAGGQFTFEIVDLVVAGTPYVFGIGAIDVRHDHIFIMGTVEYGNPPRLWALHASHARGSRGRAPRPQACRSHGNGCPSGHLG